MLPQRQEGTGNREEYYIDPNSCFSDLSDSLNSMKALLHLGKLHWPNTNLIEFSQFEPVNDDVNSFWEIAKFS